MKTTRLIVAVGLVAGSFSFCNAQSAMESAKPVKQNVEITKELEQRVREGAARASKKKVQAMSLEEGNTYSAKRATAIDAKRLRVKKGEQPKQTTK